MCCQMRTDNPKAEPSERATVPTMTADATTLLVMPSMMMKIRQSDATTAIMTSYRVPSWMSL
ncbi:Uncharacterised protein [Mycobacterium tuberculosis]|uniref:Uncharacterized protein n=2 Tax=Mycobacterium tuberculosis TaxID=1773 RepID=A0A916L752_MYCTX|nr:Uncharacterised protein [Mycobacterium tuberculosis]COW75858.1 Uncharacterised protein [Mycobacterium tuberculosis]